MCWCYLCHGWYDRHSDAVRTYVGWPVERRSVLAEQSFSYIAPKGKRGRGKKRKKSEGGLGGLVRKEEAKRLKRLREGKSKTIGEKGVKIMGQGLRSRVKALIPCYCLSLTYQSFSSATVRNNTTKQHKHTEPTHRPTSNPVEMVCTESMRLVGLVTSDRGTRQSDTTE